MEFTKEQKEYLINELRWLNNAVLDRWLNYLPEKDTNSQKSVQEKNPAHFCDCGKYLGHRGFCSNACHDKHYDANSINHAQQEKDEVVATKMPRPVENFTNSIQSEEVKE